MRRVQIRLRLRGTKEMNLISFLTLITVSLYIKTPVVPPAQGPLTTEQQLQELITPLTDPGTNGKWRFHCSATYISSDEILTAGHCVNTKDAIFKIRDYYKEEAPAKVVFTDFKSDLAILKVQRTCPKHAKIGHTPCRGERICMLSSEDNMPGTFTQGIAANVYLDPEYFTPQIVHTCPMIGGASGSGLFDKDGQLIGVNVQTQGVVSYAVETTRVRHFIEDYRQRVNLTK